MMRFDSSGTTLLYVRIWASGNRSTAVKMSKGLACLSVSMKIITVFLSGLDMIVHFEHTLTLTACFKTCHAQECKQRFVRQKNLSCGQKTEPKNVDYSS